MVKRAAALEETRARIVAATVEAHGELGIQQTSWDEIARRAGVGVGTVYRHFRSLDELLPACGQTVEQAMALPTRDELAHAFDSVHSLPARIDRLVQLVFDVYERAAPFIHNIRNERGQLPQLEPWNQMIDGTLDALVKEALRPVRVSRLQCETARALLDLSTWEAFRRRGVALDAISRTVGKLIHSAVRPTHASDRPGSAAS